MKTTKIEGGCLWTVLIITLLSFPAWLTHVIYCFKTEAWGFLIAGAIAAPIGVIHGWLIWLGIV